jgi:hypothetical protein
LVTEAIKGTNADPANYLIAMKYLETLKEMTSGQNNKVIYIPYEATGVLSSVGGIKEMLARGIKSHTGHGGQIGHSSSATFLMITSRGRSDRT